MTTLSQRKSPLTDHQREMIATVVNQCGGFRIAPTDVWTLHTNKETNVLWVHLYDGKQLPFDCGQFRKQLDKIRLQQRIQKADDCQVIAVQNNSFTVLNTTNGNTYTVEPHRVFSNQRCTCGDCRKRNQLCKHQITVKRYHFSLKSQLAAAV